MHVLVKKLIMLDMRKMLQTRIIVKEMTSYEDILIKKNPAQSQFICLKL